MKTEKETPGVRRECRILCVADHIDPLVYSAAVKTRFSHVDMIVSCGDLKPDYYDYIVTSLNVPLYYVLGNHSVFTTKSSLSSNQTPWDGGGRKIRRFQGGVMMEGRLVYLKEFDLILGGFGGSRRYSPGDNQYTELEMAFRIFRMIPRLLWNKMVRGRYIDILVTHASPRGVNDRDDLCHKGFRVFNWFLRRFRPRYQLHGHIHLYDRNAIRRSWYRETEVINAYDHIELAWSGPS